MHGDAELLTIQILDFFLVFLGSQYHHAHEVEIFSILKDMKNKLKGLFWAIISHFGPFWACYRLWIFKKDFLGSQYHFAHEVKTFLVLKSKNRWWGLVLAILDHFGHVTYFGFFKNFFWVISITLHIKLRHS